jgi:(p)ppGpp synthase/HD superfamily hydrolase
MWSADVYATALRFAAERHLVQKVPGTELPYIVHVAMVAGEVMATLTRERFEEPDLAVSCALLHDVVEDTDTSIEDIAERFGTRVAMGVAALTKDPAAPEAHRMTDSLRRIREQPREVWIVKLGDRITNLQPPPAYWNDEKRRAYRMEARVIHAALGEASPYLAARMAEKIEAYPAG